MIKDQTTSIVGSSRHAKFEIKLRKYASLFETNTTEYQHIHTMSHLFDEGLRVVYSKDVRSIWTIPKSSGTEMDYDGLYAFIYDFKHRSRILRKSWNLTIINYIPLESTRAVVTLRIDIDGKQTLHTFVITLKGDKIIDARQIDSTGKKDVKKAVRAAKKQTWIRFLESDFMNPKDVNGIPRTTLGGGFLII